MPDSLDRSAQTNLWDRLINSGSAFVDPVNGVLDIVSPGIGTVYRQIRPKKVGRVGIEPTTPGLKVRCSAELS